MTTEELEEEFKKASPEFIRFERVFNKKSKRPDLHAFLLLDELVPGTDDMIVSSAHDEFYLSIDLEKLAEVATPEIIVDLHRCGVRYGEYGLCMFA